MKTTDDIDTQAADWVARRDKGELAPDEAQAFDDWLDASIGHRVAYLRLDSVWTRADRLRALPASVRQPVPAFGFRVPRLSAGQQRWAPHALLAVAAMVVALVLGGPASPSGESHDYATPVGAREAIVLNDGSKVTLNTATRLRASVNARQRTVWLDDGEAFFNVVHDASRPFEVIAGKRRVVVTGTRFSVRRDGDRLTLTVLDGRVRVQSDDNLTTVVSKNEAALGEGANILVTHEDEAKVLASVGWLEGRLNFDQTTMADAAAEFNRYNKRHLVIADSAAAGIRIGGSFEAGNVDAFARLVESGFGLTVRTADDEIRVSSAR